MNFDQNAYIRKDSASASNTYYGYALSSSTADADFSWAIKRVNTSGNVETTSWSNGSNGCLYSCWANRTSSFTAPTTISLTYSKDTSTPYYIANISWSASTGVERYSITSRDINSKLLDNVGNIVSGPMVNDKFYTDLLINKTSYSQRFISSGTYTVVLTSMNAGGSTSTSSTIFFS